MEVSGRICIKVDDEQLDEIVVDHCNSALETCLTILELERKAMVGKSGYEVQCRVENVLDYENYVFALRTVIDYFGGVAINKSV